jgi:predicted RecA/RadA family phage recombinase
MAEATLVKSSLQEDITLASALDGGDVVQCPSGRIGVLSGGNQTYATGDVVAADTVGQFDVASASATTFSAGDDVGWDNTNKLAVAGAGGDFDIGVAALAKASGTTVVRVILNEASTGD